MINQGLLSEKLYDGQGVADESDCRREIDTNWNLNDVVDENRLSQVLAQALLPSMANKISIQALLVYQSDDNENKSFMINGCFQREIKDDDNLCFDLDGKDCVVSMESTISTDNSATSNGWNDLSTERVQSPIIKDCDNLLGQTSSRRKRKFARPCKIPQIIEQTSNSPALQNDSVVMKSEQQPVSFQASTPIKNEQNIYFPLLSESLLNALSNKFIRKSDTLPMPMQPNLPSTNLQINTPRPIRPKLVVENNLKKQSCALQGNICPSEILSASAAFENLPLEASATYDSEDSLAAARRYAKSFVCNQCRFVFSSLNGLCEHTYSLHKAFRCTFCQAQFTQRSNLQRHSLRHVGFKPFVCGVCSKEYYRKDHLVRHIEVTHPGSDSKNSVIVKLSSAECLEYLEALTEQKHRELSMTAPIAVVSTESEGIPASDVL